ncbi:arginine repressor [Propionibacteriaceae bacterium G1746]|uniref:arginine repressor n=1 Tax=Aestuariimicrobium sp. G57 TaxID=3418485 RepID=UPI003C13F8C8
MSEGSADEVAERPLSRAARRALVQSLIESRPVSSQTELADLLAVEGVQVTQGTISKDLLELRAVRQRDADGTMRYVVPDDEPTGEQSHLLRLSKLCTEMLLDVVPSGNLVVVHTPAGAAQYFASALDRSGLDGVLGTIAGDDTVLLIAHDSVGGEDVARTLRAYAAGVRPR